MRRFQLSLAAVLVAVAVTAGPAAANQDPLEKVMWAVKCAGESLGGNACHSY